MNTIRKFLEHHKRGCPENRGQPCTCGLHEARAELEAIGAVIGAARDVIKNRELFRYPPLGDLADALEKTGVK